MAFLAKRIEEKRIDEKKKIYYLFLKLFYFKW